MKIFQMSEHDWVAAETMEEAKACLAKTLSVENLEDLDEYLDNPRELTEAELDSYEYDEIEFEDDRDSGDEQATACSFRRRLEQLTEAGTKFPCHFACAE